MNQSPEEYPFPADPESTDYRVFPPALEDDEHVFFHGTADVHRASIFDDGFAIPAPPLAQSVSFAKNSSLSLRYVADARSDASPVGCIIAVRYDDLARAGLRCEVSMVHDYTLDPPPQIVGYCVIPSWYSHH